MEVFYTPNSKLTRTPKSISLIGSEASSDDEFFDAPVISLYLCISEIIVVLQVNEHDIHRLQSDGEIFLNVHIKLSHISSHSISHGICFMFSISICFA